MKEINQIKNQAILHADVNNFYASVECALKPELFGKPVAVTGNPKKRTGIILAKNEIAKSFGIKTGQVIGEAQALCPDLICLPPHFDLYEEISQSLHNIYLDYTNFVEPLGLDECWLDVTHSLRLLGKTPKEIADELRARAKKELNLTLSVGVSFSKIFAKLGSDMRKPDYTTEIPYDKFKEITYHLPLNSIVGIGKRLERRFSSIGVKTIGDFTFLEDSYLKSVMGINGTNLKEDLLGVRNVSVCDYYTLPPPKSIGNGTTTTKDIYTAKEVEKVIYFLAQKVSSRMIRHKVKGQTISLAIKNNSLKSVHKSMKINPTNEVKTIANEAMKICLMIFDFSSPVRAVRLKMSSLSNANIQQTSMFDSTKGNVSQTIDLINQKYGKIMLASNMSPFINDAKSPHN